jgi:hypothetical protein
MNGSDPFSLPAIIQCERLRRPFHRSISTDGKGDGHARCSAERMKEQSMTIHPDHEASHDEKNTTPSPTKPSRARSPATRCASLLALALALPLVAPPAHAATARAAVGVHATVYPAAPPPEVVPEDRPVAPGQAYYYVPGHWNWTGNDWAWVSGYWVPQRAGYVYVAPRYVWEGDRWVYYRAYWQAPRGHREYAYNGRVAIRPEWRAQPRVDPRAWRAEHREMRQVAVERQAAEHHAAEHREAERIAAERRAAEHHALEHREAEHIAAKGRATANREAERREAEHIAAERRNAAAHQAAHREAEQRGVQNARK